MHDPERSQRATLMVASAIALAGCVAGDADEASTASGSQSPCEPSTTADQPPVDDKLSWTRLLRRTTLTLTGQPPTVERYQEMLSAPSDEAREALLQATIDDALESTAFYQRMVELGHDWLKTEEFATGQGEGYQGSMSGTLRVCGGDSKHPGAYFNANELAENGPIDNICDDLDIDGLPAPPAVHEVEPWWAPGTTVTVLGRGGLGTTEVADADGKTIDCGVAGIGYHNPLIPNGCSCGPNLVFCAPNIGLGCCGSNDEVHQKRHAWEEPARLFAHLAWHDRPLSDLVLGNYSVGTNQLRALYVRFARYAGANKALDDDTTWWRPDAEAEPRDPMHPEPNDPLAWREFVVERLSPFHLALTPDQSPSGDLERTYQYDPRTTKEPPAGIPTAGVLTMIGNMSSFARERPRAARYLEMFACRAFVPPPAEVTFNPYDGDPATSGTCQHCHVMLDPAAIAFKRWDFSYSYVLWPFIPGVGPWALTPEQFEGNYPYSALPFTRWKDSFVADTVLTPVTPEQLEDNPAARFLDTIPTDYELLGEHGDGTMGPLGFAKILVRSGEFDECVVRRFYERFVGRPLDPATESGYIRALAKQFVDNDRQVRGFVRYLTSTSDFRRGF